MPVSVVEALMYGRPCIATPVGGIPDLIRDEVEGMIVPVGDSEALANAMERFVSIDGNELDSFRRRARRRYEEMCRPDVVCERIAGTYADVLESACGVPEHTGS